MSGARPDTAGRFLLACRRMDAARTITTDEPDPAPEAPAGDAGRVTTKAGDDIARVTPMMEQYIEIKAANPDCLLFYRMGDFYEMFFGDAEIAARALGIMLTKRGKHLGQDIPMCGVPVERADEYLHRLIAQGHRVAVCEQLEDPAEAKKRGGKSVVRRNVVRLGPAGTPKTRGSTPPATIICWRWCAAAPRPATTVSRWPGSIFRPANFGSPNATAPASAPRLRASSPARSSFPTCFIAIRSLRRSCAHSLRSCRSPATCSTAPPP